jgi:hypothetical protein
VSGSFGWVSCVFLGIVTLLIFNTDSEIFSGMKQNLVGQQAASVWNTPTQFQTYWFLKYQGCSKYCYDWEFEDLMTVNVKKTLI